jgi:pimeloyl-ACP methyl ester carboxylesterase
VSDIRYERIRLSTGVSLNVALAGPEDGEPILFLHGFPESHRTWRNQIADLSADCRAIAPDQRGFGASEKPEGVEEYASNKAVDDALALMDALGIDHFTLAGHDWGGAVAWAAAFKHPLRIKRLIIVNAPHPIVFQRTVIEDEAQREASQYINWFRSPLAEIGIKAMGYEAFLEKVLLTHSDPTKLPEEERQHYLDDWTRPGALTAMLNWYRAAGVEVPAMGEDAKVPLAARVPLPKLRTPTLVVWGMKDPALLPIQFEGMADHVADLRVVTSETAGHFITWEEPGTVTSAIRAFLDETRDR